MRFDVHRLLGFRAVFATTRSERFRVSRPRFIFPSELLRRAHREEERPISDETDGRRYCYPRLAFIRVLSAYFSTSKSPNVVETSEQTLMVVIKYTHAFLKKPRRTTRLVKRLLYGDILLSLVMSPVPGRIYFRVPLA